MARSIRLRRWPKDALERLAAKAEPDFLAVATPGAGKTTFALTAVRQDLARHPHRRVVVVAPTQHLKTQWADAAAAFDLHLDPAWSAASGTLPADVHGVVTTYQQVATSARALHQLARGSFVVFDELHHAGDERSWGDSVRVAFDGAARRLALSGTPFRSDASPIPFVDYVHGVARPDFEYGYGDALRDGGVVRPVYFPRVNGQMEWTASDGTYHAHSFDDALDAARANQRLRTALSPDGEWLPVVLSRAHAQLMQLRAGGHPEAAGLVIALDQEHARAISALMTRRLGVTPAVATSDDPDASARIARFAASSHPWIVAVRMVSEGVDIPRLRVGVFATTTTTELFFRQAVGRLVRWVRGVPGQRAYLFIPDDGRLRTHALTIAEQRRHSIRRDSDEDAEDQPPREASPLEEGEQLSLFAAISAVATDIDGLDHLDETEPIMWSDDEVAEDGLTIELAPPPRLAGHGSGPGPRHDHRKRLREANSEHAREIARFTGMTHAQVNAELNRLAGVRRIAEATVTELERRLQHADRWLRRL
jgi:superfamily II DNA or RNA helicase